MERKEITFNDLPELIAQLIEEVATMREEIAELGRSGQLEEDNSFKSIYHNYIPKTEVRGVLASNSTLWHWEKEGKLKLYGIGGKRFYKRSDIEKLFEQVHHGEKGFDK